MKRLIDFIPNASEHGEYVVVCSPCFGRVFEADVEPMLNLTDKNGASLLRVVADCDDVIERLIDELIDILGMVV